MRLSPKNGDKRQRYLWYLRSPEWKKKREAALEFYGWSCGDCGGTQTLQAHHKTYDRLFEERVSDLEVLCKECHRNRHRVSA